MARRKRTVVGRPLTPDLLGEIGAMGSLPPVPGDFAPDGSWTQTYRIWTCHGYRESGNADRGFLRLTRTPGEGPTPFVLNVEQDLVNDEGVLHRTHAEITCRHDVRASLLRWTRSSRTFGPEGGLRARLAVEEEARVYGDRIEVEVGGHTFKRPGSPRLAADWGLFEAVQRLPFEESSALDIDVLEGLSLFKPGARLSYHGTGMWKTGDRTVALHEFCQIGHGTLPYRYWLDDRHRLVVVVTLSRAYILDPEAERAVERALERERMRFHRRQKRGKEARRHG